MSRIIALQLVAFQEMKGVTCVFRVPAGRVQTQGDEPTNEATGLDARESKKRAIRRQDCNHFDAEKLTENGRHM